MGSMFTGYGGLDMGIARVLDVETRWHADNAPGPAGILAHRYPDIPNLGDVREIDYTRPGMAVDILACGFPCQDVSAAGRRVGTRGERTRLYTETIRAIDALRPKLVIAENVRGLLVANGTTPDRSGFGDVLAALTDVGYDAAWQVRSAASIGAPHRRERVFVAAWPATADAPRVEWRQRRRLRARNAPELGWRLPTDDPSPATAQPTPNAHARQGGAFPWGKYEPAIQRWRTLHDPLVPDVFIPGTERVTAQFCEWLMGLPRGWVSEAAITRRQQVEALGNGVVPAQAAAALMGLLEATAAT